MKTVIEMAQEAGVISGFSTVHPSIEAFAELVRADEREKYKWDVHSCGPTCKRYACMAMREAIEAEREACAKVVEQGHYAETRAGHAAAIRARSNT